MPENIFAKKAKDMATPSIHPKDTVLKCNSSVIKVGNIEKTMHEDVLHKKQVMDRTQSIV